MKPLDASREPVLRIDNAVRTFGGGRRLFGKPAKVVRAVDGVSLTIRSGETLGLVGESGSGKSTLGRIALRLVEPTSGQVFLDGRELTGIPLDKARAARRDIQMVFQDPYGALDPRVTIGDSIAEPMKVHGLWDTEGPRKVAGLMRLVGLDPAAYDRYPHQFSGGQRQRIGIARALTLNPKVLVLDEPVSALDVSIQAQIINLLQKIQRERELSFLFIAHDLAVVRHVSHRIMVMYLGKMVELASRASLYGRPLHPYTVTLLAAVPMPRTDGVPQKKSALTIGEIGSATKVPSGCRFHPRCYRAALMAKAPGVETVEADGQLRPAACVRREPGLTAFGEDQVACHFPETPETRSEIAAGVLAGIGAAGTGAIKPS